MPFNKLRVLIFMVACLVLCLTGCSDQNVDQVIRSSLGEETVQASEHIVDLLTSHDAEGLAQMAHPQARPAFENEGALEALFNMVPQQAPDTVRFLRFDTRYFNSTQQDAVVEHDVFMLLTFGEHQTQLFMKFRVSNDQPSLWYMNYTPIEEPEIQSVSDFKPMDWVALSLAPTMALFVLFTLIATLRTRRLKRKILWSLFVAFIGYPVFGYSTAAGEWALLAPSITSSEAGAFVQIVKITLFSAMWEVNQFTGHHAVQIAAPIGAISFWIQRSRGKLVRKADPRQVHATETNTDAVSHATTVPERSKPNAE